MSPTTIRAATPADLEILARWAEAMALETEGKVLDATTIRAGIAAGLADPHKARYLIAEHDGRAVGTLMLTTEWSDWRNGWWWWIQSVFVAEDARRLGVFRALHDHVEREALATLGVCGLRLYVENDNARAQATYAALGMRDAHYRVFEAEFRRG
ncbi:GNAT family N-acetyltransferase [Silanimonas sp.]|jgi:GNAT superfamily N-acetyltransferase|uniref:GNAT family N-acetyltransferase n=1 Tax=Silanimonas sp. TaxID=1929290 RepID=UPI0022CC7997|nr:GNAT family N-acetyltransferase [Silanimonas sp.]MCZ8115648.1 GNAT family N-acetyltransferase [Silanimonas sp.]